MAAKGIFYLIIISVFNRYGINVSAILHGDLVGRTSVYNNSTAMSATATAPSPKYTTSTHTPVSTSTHTPVSTSTHTPVSTSKTNHTAYTNYPATASATHPVESSIASTSTPNSTISLRSTLTTTSTLTFTTTSTSAPTITSTSTPTTATTSTSKTSLTSTPTTAPTSTPTITLTSTHTITLASTPTSTSTPSTSPTPTPTSTTNMTHKYTSTINSSEFEENNDELSGLGENYNETNGFGENYETSGFGEKYNETSAFGENHNETSRDDTTLVDDTPSTVSTEKRICNACSMVFVGCSMAFLTTWPTDVCGSVRCLHGARCHNGQCRCPPSCPHLERPVCASDLRTYMSYCDMVAHMCVSNVTLYIAKEGTCSIDPCVDVVCEYGASCLGGLCRCPRTCAQIYRPVCGSDWVTYSSVCQMTRVACLEQRTVRLQYRIPCDRVPPLRGVSIEESRGATNIMEDGTLILLFVSFGAVIIMIVIAIVVVRKIKHPVGSSRSRRLSRVMDTEMTSDPAVKCTTRTSSSSSQQRRVSMELRADTGETLPGFLTPIQEQRFICDVDANGNPSNDVIKRGIPIRRLLSSTDSSVVELVPDEKARVEDELGIDNIAVQPVKINNAVKQIVERRDMPGRRHGSSTENSVYEIGPDQSAMVCLDDVFANNHQMITKL